MFRTYVRTYTFNKHLHLLPKLEQNFIKHYALLFLVALRDVTRLTKWPQRERQFSTDFNAVARTSFFLATRNIRISTGMKQLHLLAYDLASVTRICEFSVSHAVRVEFA